MATRTLQILRGYRNYNALGKRWRERYLDLLWKHNQLLYDEAHKLWTGEGGHMVNFVASQNPGLHDRILQVVAKDVIKAHKESSQS